MKRIFVLLVASACSSSSTTTSDAGKDGMTMNVDAGMDSTTSSCNAAVEQLLKPIDMVSTGEVNILMESGGVRTLYVDASAGGINMSDLNPRVYISLETGKRVDVTDVQARKSTAWDLSLKRYVIFTNGGQGGPGMGGALFINKGFDQVTSADAMKPFAIEAFVDQDCNQLMDPLGGLLTTLSDWYDYNQATMFVTPKANVTYAVRGATGKLYKVAITQYYGTPDGGMGMSGARYILKVAPL